MILSSETDFGITIYPWRSAQSFFSKGGSTYVLQTPPEEDLGLRFSLGLCYFLDWRVIEPHGSCQRTPCLLSALTVKHPEEQLTSSKIPLSWQILTISGCLMKGCRSIWLTTGNTDPASSNSWICFVPQLLTPIDLTKPCFWASTHALQHSFRTSGPPMAEWRRYMSKYGTPVLFREARRSERVLS